MPFKEHSLTTFNFCLQSRGITYYLCKLPPVKAKGLSERYKAFSGPRKIFFVFDLHCFQFL